MSSCSCLACDAAMHSALCPCSCNDFTSSILMSMLIKAQVCLLTMAKACSRYFVNLQHMAQFRCCCACFAGSPSAGLPCLLAAFAWVSQMVTVAVTLGGHASAFKTATVLADACSLCRYLWPRTECLGRCKAESELFVSADSTPAAWLLRLVSSFVNQYTSNSLFSSRYFS